MSKLLKPRYEYYKGTTEVFDNELDNFVDDVVYRLNAQDFYKRRLLKEKQNQDEQITDLQYRLDVAEKALDNLYDKFIIVAHNYGKMNIIPSKLHFKEQAESELKGE